MIVYEFKANITVSGGSANSLSHRNVGGMLNYVLIRALTNNQTTFNATISDTDGTVRTTYDFHAGEIVDNQINLPLVGQYQVNILNASQTDTFKVILGVLEKM